MALAGSALRSRPSLRKWHAAIGTQPWRRFANRPIRYVLKYLNKVSLCIPYRLVYNKYMKTLQDLIGGPGRAAPLLQDFPRQIGDRVRRQRLAFHWRQEDFARRAGVSVQTIKALEKGDAISYENLFRLLLALGHGADFLRMLESPHFPDLDAQERFIALAHADDVRGKRVRPRAGGMP